MATTHTPGPWAAIGTDVKTPGPRSRILCWTGQPEVEMGEARANARLIAAAPDMLAALQAVAAWLSDDDVSRSPLDPQRARLAKGWAAGAVGPCVREAIAKAGG